MAGQTLLLLVVGLTLSHAVSMIFYAHDRDALLAATGGREFAHRATTVVQVVAAVPAPLRDRVARATEAADLDVAVNPQNPLVHDHENDWRARLIRQLLLEELGPAYRDRIMVQVLDALPEDTVGLASLNPLTRADVRTSVGLGDGTWVTVSGALPEASAAPSGGAVASTVIMFAGVLGLSVIVVRRMTRPLRDLARAAERLGRDVTAPPLDERGPDEVRRATGAFNDMQARLRRFVEDRTQMLAAISHDLRTPITLLRLRAEFIDDDEERDKTLSTLAEMEDMIRSTLAFAREDAETEPMQQVDVSALVQSLCDDLAEAGQPVACAEAPTCVMACRPQALRRAVSNLVQNAVRYGGRAVVTLERAADAVLIHVDDDGPGIAEDQMERVFRPFYRVEASRGRATGGVGLGLSIVASVAHAHGGDVRLANRAGGGLRASLRLPVARGGSGRS
ncbi:histidine kinase [Caenispirillum salinarum AK4]|uniref:histidine kinase n=2 Tax=Caenispirillum TaxID=414051 RepID=K9HED8_9PROT|nr:histidine kinase [Caenispirillum salinarum AK4]